MKRGRVMRVGDWLYLSSHKYVDRGIYGLNWAGDYSVRGLEMGYLMALGPALSRLPH